MIVRTMMSCLILLSWCFGLTCCHSPKKEKPVPFKWCPDIDLRNDSAPDGEPRKGEYFVL